MALVTRELVAEGVWLIGMLLAVGVSAASVFFAWRFGTTLGGAGFWPYVKPAVLSGQDAFKFLLPTLVMGAWERGKKKLASIGALGFLCLSLLSTWSIFSVELLDQSVMATERAAAEEHLADLRSDVARTEARLKMLGETRPVASVDADITNTRQDHRWAASKGCTEVANGARAFCAGYNRLFGELAGAEEAETLRGRLDTAKNEINSARRAPARSNSELQLIEKLLGIESAIPIVVRALMLALTLEIAGNFFVTLVWVNRPRGSSRPRRKSKVPGAKNTPPQRATVRPGAATGAVDVAWLGAVAGDGEPRRTAARRHAQKASAAPGSLWQQEERERFRDTTSAAAPIREQAGENSFFKPCQPCAQLADDGPAKPGMPNCPGLQGVASFVIQAKREELTARKEGADFEGTAESRCTGVHARSRNYQNRFCSSGGRGAERDAHVTACEATCNAPGPNRSSSIPGPFSALHPALTAVPLKLAHTAQNRRALAPRVESRLKASACARAFLTRWALTVHRAILATANRIRAYISFRARRGGDHLQQLGTRAHLYT